MWKVNLITEPHIIFSTVSLQIANVRNAKAGVNLETDNSFETSK
jgi:hypothetical protein